jgi:hypothetical protein
MLPLFPSILSPSNFFNQLTDFFNLIWTPSGQKPHRHWNFKFTTFNNANIATVQTPEAGVPLAPLLA